MAMVGIDSAIISADPEVLVETAERAHQQILAYRHGLETIAAAIRSSEATWIGEAGDAYRAVFRAELAKVEEALDEFAVYPSELLEHAGLYSASMARAEAIESSVSTFQMV